MCDVDEEAVVTAADAPSIYDIPKVLHREGLDAYVVRRLDLPFRDVDWTLWDDLLRRVHHPKEEVTIALVGKYIDLPDAYLSVAEALRAGGFAHEAKVHIRWIASDECETPAGAARHLSDVDAICVPGGFGIRGIEGKLGALTYARTHGIPTLGLCLGLQCMVIEYARTVAGLEKAASTEFDPDCPEPVIATMEEQKAFVEGAGDLGGTMRLGLYPADLSEGTRRARGVRRGADRGTAPAPLRGQQRLPRPARGGRPGLLRHLPGQDLVEFVELPRDVHPYYVATQAHPELRSRPTRPHPLFAGLVGAAIERQRSCGSRSTSPGCAATAARRRGLRRDRRPRRWPTGPRSGRSLAPSDLHRDDWVVALRADLRPSPGPRATSRSAGWSLEHPGAVVVLAVDDDERVLLPVAVPAPGRAPVRRAAGGAVRRRRRGAARRWPPASCARRPSSRRRHWTHLARLPLAGASPPRCTTLPRPRARPADRGDFVPRPRGGRHGRAAGCRSRTCSPPCAAGAVHRRPRSSRCSSPEREG